MIHTGKFCARHVKKYYNNKNIRIIVVIINSDEKSRIANNRLDNYYYDQKMNLEPLGGEVEIRNLISSSQSEDEEERKRAISKIPRLILQFSKSEDDILNQLLLVIYNLNTHSDPYEDLTASNRVPVFRQLLRLYTDSIKDHDHEQIDALTQLIDLVYSSDLLVELAYALNQCKSDLGGKDTEMIDEAFESIREKAAVNLYPEALLMIHSILAMKQLRDTPLLNKDEIRS